MKLELSQIVEVDQVTERNTSLVPMSFPGDPLVGKHDRTPDDDDLAHLGGGLDAGTEPFDLVPIDIHMPEFDGWEVVVVRLNSSVIRESNEAVPQTDEM